MSTQQALQRSLRDARFEVLPLRGTADGAGQLAAGTTVTVTSSPSKGPEATLDLAAELSWRGVHVVPHLAARMVTDRAHLSALLDRVDDIRGSEVFVVAGDAQRPAGEFTDALSLLRAMEEMGRRPSRIGITGYPESHAFVPDDSVVHAMTEKARYADYIVSQICFDPNTIAAWVHEVRSRGILLPIHVGVPGAVDVTKLLRISMRIGLGDSVRFLRKQHGVVTKLLTRYTPEDLFDELSPYLADPFYGIAGWHFFTFNEITKTQRWRDDLASRMHEVPA